MKLTLTISIVCLLLLFGCGKQAKLTEPEKLVGINGEALYWLGNSGHPVKVIKPEYDNQDFMVTLDRDTVFLGENLTGAIVVAKTEFKAVLDAPVIDKYEKTSDNGRVRWEFSYPQKAEGLFDFKGHIEYDTLIVPFEYKFLVIKK